MYVCMYVCTFVLLTVRCSLTQRRQTFINAIVKVNTHFIKFDKKNLFDYILSLNDYSIFDLTVLFIKDIMENYISAISKLQN